MTHGRGSAVCSQGDGGAVKLDRCCQGAETVLQYFIRITACTRLLGELPVTACSCYLVTTLLNCIQFLSVGTMSCWTCRLLLLRARHMPGRICYALGACQLA